MFAINFLYRLFDMRIWDDFRNGFGSSFADTLVANRNKAFSPSTAPFVSDSFRAASISLFAQFMAAGFHDSGNSGGMFPTHESLGQPEPPLSIVSSHATHALIS